MATPASTRVLGIGELLDMILLECAAWEQQLAPFRPVTKLFVFQRINRKFHDAVNSSEVLRRAMFLEHADAEEFHEILLANEQAGRPADHNWGAVQWLVDIPTSTGGLLEWAGPRKLKRYKPDRLLYKAIILTRGMLHPTATWRKMKIFRVSPDILPILTL
ncbi:hypothetical protein BST61_g5705 [Cercospora zeina]